MIESLPRREREIFEVLCGLEEGTAAAIGAALNDPPSNSAVRALLSRLVAKGLVVHRTVDQTYIYSPASGAASVAETSLQRMVRTFFDGSVANAATALLGMAPKLKDEELDALQKLIDDARERGQ
jgi:predicted transcriptional regulator